MFQSRDSCTSNGRLFVAASESGGTCGSCQHLRVIDLPILESDEEREPRLLIFDDAFNSQVCEQSWSGLVTILDLHVTGERSRYAADDERWLLETFIASESEFPGVTSQPREGIVHPPRRSFLNTVGIACHMNHRPSFNFVPGPWCS